MQTKGGQPTVLHAEHLFSGRRRTQAISFLAELTQSCFTLISQTHSAPFAISGEAATTTPTPSTCSTSMEGRRWKSSCLYVVK